MPLYDTGWTPTPSGTYLVEIRQDYEVAIGTVPEYAGTPAGARTTSSAELAWRVDQGAALVLSTMLLATAPRAVVVARAMDAGIEPRAATSSRYTVRVPSGSSGTLTIGQQVQDGDRRLWRIVDIDGTTTGSAAVVALDPVVIEAVQTGPLLLPGVLTELGMVTPVTGIDALEWPGSGTFSQGRVEETTPELRQRIQGLGVGGSPSGVRSAIRQIPWVVAVDVSRAAGSVGVSVAPGPVGADQIAELAGVIYEAVAEGIETTGTSSTSITDLDGYPLTIRWSAGVTQAVAVVYTLTLDGTVSAADALSAADAAVRAEFAALTQGEPIRYLRAFAALDLPGVTGATLTLNGGTSDITPSTAADVLIPSPLTGTVP